MARLDRVIGRLRRLRRQLENPVEFFTAHLPGWTDLARSTALEVLLQNRPEQADPGDWALQAQYTAGQVAGWLTGGDLFETVGAMIYLGARRELSFTSTAMAAMGNRLSVEEIAAYVEAGMRGDPLGKADIDERDEGRTPRQIALNISRSIEKGNADREALVRAFLEARNAGDAQALYGAILEAWVAAIGVRARDDWAAYVARLARG